MTTLPTWAFWLTAFGAPIAGVTGVIDGHLVTRNGLAQADRWRHREETMRMLRWSAEQVGSANDQLSDMGLASLTALLESELLQAEDVAFIEAVAEAAMDSLPAEIREYRDDKIVLDVAEQRQEA